MLKIEHVEAARDVFQLEREGGTGTSILQCDTVSTLNSIYHLEQVRASDKGKFYIGIPAKLPKWEGLGAVQDTVEEHGPE